ncbi:DUF294 nucleotidyltransferase-like domain-containing protein [Cytobacillus purgationiresistens]|uniref:CBS domain-containing protein n=1 Tax=Cytobacillus purgationiresistens TaxID=863449 RepID=A0ABU0ACP1_9BACI|nr:DUF294 nucleotidyltransferase-like domain-containing protein [Cytobacillus purgationiresistens]MDQ0268654.1 CBS domain-containing protein [Cytobacillus purgationiresistens]
MAKNFESYEEIKKWRDEEIRLRSSDTTSLNQFHDEVMKAVYALASKTIRSEAPCKFAWFVTGSGGRGEQGLVSDQDHGIVYEKGDKHIDTYFADLGKELSDGLNTAGYPYCEGKVMSSNPIWCKPIDEWRKQLIYWMDEGSWATIRSLQIFYDARVLIGEADFINIMKEDVHQYENEHPNLLKRLLDNVRHIKNSIGPLGQILTEDKGKYSGSIDLKYAAFIPYVNGIRLLSLKEGMKETSTIRRMDALLQLKPYNQGLKKYKESFTDLLTYRLSLMNDVESYDDAHHLFIKDLDKRSKKDMKQILKNGKKLHQYVAELIEQGVK